MPLPEGCFCSLCSLLCETPGDFGTSFCSRRNAAWDRLLRLEDESVDSLSGIEGFAKQLASGKRSLQQARALLVTGRFRSVEASRGALQLARAYGGTLDGWESDAAFDAILATQRSGGYTVSLSEARDRSDLVIVCGCDAWLEDYPRFPYELSRAQGGRAILLGEWTQDAVQFWVNAGWDVRSVEIPIEKIPRSLAAALGQMTPHTDASELASWLADTTYLTVAWSTKYLGVAWGDLWHESMMQWIAERNQSHRCAGLVWSGLDSGFHQTCTWTTGFPGRVRWKENAWHYDPTAYAASRFLLEQTRTENDDRPILVWIDETVDALPETLLDSHLRSIVIGPRQPTKVPEGWLWFPSGLAGWTHPARFFRGDQALMVCGMDRNPSASSRLPVAAWIEGLLEP